MIGILLGSAETSGERGLCPRWVRAIANHGLSVVAIHSGQDGDYYEHLLDVLHGILLPGGDTDVFCPSYDYSNHKRKPEFDIERDKAAALLTRASVAQGIPLLGICRGMQEMNIAMGGTLSGLAGHDHGYQYKDQRETEIHEIIIQDGGVLKNCAPHIDQVFVNSIHRFGITRKELAPKLIAEAFCPSDDVVEALSIPKHRFFLGVQFHAEFSSTGGLNEIIFARFTKAAKDYAVEHSIQVPDVIGKNYTVLHA